MLFSVIYSVDCPEDEDVLDFAPSQVDELWQETEGDEGYEYSYLEGRWEEGSHRKCCAVRPVISSMSSFGAAAWLPSLRRRWAASGHLAAVWVGSRPSHFVAIIPTPFSRPT